jgi:mxaJ protein
MRPKIIARHIHRSALCVALGAAMVFVAPFAPSLAAEGQQQRELVVCADADNLPFSNDKSEGFENKIVDLIAAEMHTSVRYAWNGGPRGFRPRMLQSGACNLVIGVPAGLPGVSVTRPYYTSTYVFVTARSRKLNLRSFDDPALRNLKIGLQAIGAQGANTPPANALARRGLTDNIVGYSMREAVGEQTSQTNIIDAVVKGEVDTALVWGPLAGYFAKRYGNRLVLSPVAPDPQMPTLAFLYAMSIGVSNGDDAFKAELQRVLDQRRKDIDAILNDYGIPQVTGQRDSSLSTAR